MKKVLIIDNYDSFSYNLLHCFEALGCEVTIWRNDAFELEDIEPFQHIVLSPGPGIPSEAGLLTAVISRYSGTKSILGVCLGHQAIAEVFGGKLINLERVFHGESDQAQIISRDNRLFYGIPDVFEVGRYHSWTVDPNLPDALEITSTDANGQVMSLRHKTYDVRGIQFHPESILTPSGTQILKNWIENSQL
ncbi:anthranilate synthase component II [Flavobacterium silvaticum]|uniref:Aminodeoxychorismate/anthranilate synthase component II n=1 Tax=Flavobacterium silvaticum TaxID=1852020 RepID=A0A972FQV4_9FLAO|nr:aminodeoxychorismate/anthranilate synthase component II [Flavobacterium silvaticum]NMH26813.1 aminodeoxychorismate/anthranilate synthase component II [Flavobacterium silvaticum]